MVDKKKQILLILLMMCFFLGYPLAVLGEDTIEITQEGISSVVSPAAARQAIFESVTSDVSTKYIVDIIGQQKFDRNKVSIKNKILKNSGKYILSMKSTPPTKTEKGYSMVVTLKMSLKNLQSLLLEEGLLYKIEGNPQVLPMISFQDRVNGQTYSWWSLEQQPENQFVFGQSRDFLYRLRLKLRDKGFFCLSPMGYGYRQMIPTAFMTENPRTEDFMFLGEFFTTQIVAKGYIRYLKSLQRADAFQIEINILALHSGNGRVVGEVIRNYETDRGVFASVIQRKSNEIFDSVIEDLSMQVFDAWKRGTFGSNILRLTVNGRLEPHQLYQFKKLVLEQIRDIRTLKERLFEPNRVVFEMDSSITPAQISHLIERQGLKPFKMNIMKITSDSLEVRVQ